MNSASQELSKFAFKIGSDQVVGQIGLGFSTIFHREKNSIPQNSRPPRYMLMWLARLLACVSPKRWHHIMRKKALYAGWLLKGHGTLYIYMLKCLT